MNNCERIWVISFSNNLQLIKLLKLETLGLDGYFSSIRIESIDKNAFYYFNEFFHEVIISII